MGIEEFIELKQENYKKSVNELINKYNENVDKINLYLERKRLLEDDSPKNKLLGSIGLGYIMTLMLVVFLTMTIGIEKIITIVPADIIPLLLIMSTSVFSFLTKKIYEKTHDLKKIKKFSKSRTFKEKLEEQITYEIEYQKLENRNKAIEESLNTLKTNQEYFERMSSNYNISPKNEVTNIPNTVKEINLLENTYKKLDLLTTKKYLASKFWTIRFKSNKIYDSIVYGTMGGVEAMMAIFTPLLIIKDYVSYGHILSNLLLISPLIGGIATTVCIGKRNKLYTEVFNKFNHMLGKDAIKDKTKTYNTEESQKYDIEIEKVIDQLSTYEIELQDKKRELELFNTENKDKSEINNKALEEIANITVEETKDHNNEEPQAEDKLYTETIDDEDITEEKKGPIRKKLR